MHDVSKEEQTTVLESMRSKAAWALSDECEIFDGEDLLCFRSGLNHFGS
jgi:hypothetical protein